MTTSQAVLVVLCKRPVLHQGKQRLAQTLGAASALEIAEKLLACALEDAAGWPDAVVLSPASESDTAWGHRLLAEHAVQGAEVLAQTAGNLGVRLNQLDRQLRARYDCPRIYIGSDAPLLSQTFFNTASDELQRQDTVFSRADDGGVTLMGCRHAWPDLAELPWSTDRLCDSLVSCCHQAGQTIAWLPPSYDIDVASDLPRLLRDLSEDPRPARQALLKVLQTLTIAKPYITNHTSRTIHR